MSVTIGLVLGVPPWSATAGSAVAYRLTVVLDPGRGLVSGNVEAELSCDRPCPEVLPVRLYPNALSRHDAEVDDVSFPLRFPGSFDSAWMVLDGPETHNFDSTTRDDYRGSRAGPETVESYFKPVGDGRVRFTSSFSAHVPRRFGLFSAIDGRVCALGGWFPVLSGHTEDQVEYDISISVASAGILVLGNRFFVASADAAVVTRLTWSGPLLLYFVPRAESTAFHAGSSLVLAVSRPGRSKWRQSAGRAVQTVKWGGSQHPLPDSFSGAAPSECHSGRKGQAFDNPFLVLEAPLREAVAVPFPGGILLSEHAFDVTPVKGLKRQRKEVVRAAVAASLMMSRSGMSLTDALLAMNLIHFLRWDRGENDPLAVTRFFRMTEFWGVLDKIGTDPQAVFESSVFFTPDLPAELRSSPPLAYSVCPSPRTAARLVYRILGPVKTAEALEEAILGGKPLRRSLEERVPPDRASGLDQALAPEPVDLELRSVEPQENGWKVTVCKGESHADVPIELATEFSGKTTIHTVSCPSACCDIVVSGGKNEPDVLIDPYGVFLQQPAGNEDPRLNDRNFVDLKWMVSRPYLTMSAQDPLPAAGFELNVQPRWDLHNIAWIAPSIAPGRVFLLGGWRYAFGRRVRPNFLAWTLGLGLRVGASLNGESGAIGPAFTLLHYTRGSRLNPFKGDWSYAYLYPMSEWTSGHVGARMGAMYSRVVGPNPDHVFAFRVQVDTAVGDTPEWDLPAIGGVEGLRAMAAYMVSCAHRSGVNVEYRWMATRNLSVSFFNLAWLNAIQLAFFVDGASISEDLAGQFRARTSFVDFGAGVRSQFNVLGVIPSLVAVDFAYMPRILGVDAASFNVVVGFYQPF